MLVTDDIHILTISETHLDNTFDYIVVAIHGYNICRKERNANEGGVVVYIQIHIPVNFIDYLMSRVFTNRESHAQVQIHT